MNQHQHQHQHGHHTHTITAALLLLPLAIPILFLGLIASQATQPPDTCTTPAGADMGTVDIEREGGDQRGGEPSDIGHSGTKRLGTAQLGTGELDSGELDKEQMSVAAQIVGAVRAFGATADKPRAAVIALATARQESGIRNLDYGDRDSLGTFQQRPSQGWGTPAQVRNVPHATTTFLQHLVRVPGWERMRVTDAAATVQRPAAQYRGLYQRWEPLATRLTRTLWHSSATLLPVSTDLPPACSQVAYASSGIIGYPVPRALARSNRDNWGGRGAHWSSWHTGTDFSVPCGTPVLASHPGTVEIDPSQAWAGPHLVKVSVGPGRLSTWYAHMRRVTVVDGAQVAAGQQIGEVGQEGNATGCHLHFEVHTKGGSIYGPDNVDPTTWLAQHVGKSIETGAGSFVIATFNALGHSHTAPGGDKQRWADSGPRTRGLARLITRHGPDIVGLQEFQAPQARVFAQLTGATWSRFGNLDNVVIWRRSTFTRVRAATVTIPYFHGQSRRMPLVRLRHRRTGGIITVINVHNAADVHGPAGKWRAAAIARERVVIARERAAGYPVFLVGDLNERRTAFCGITRGALMVGASGGSHSGRCRPPRRMGIDWIFGAGAAFSS